MLHAVGSGRERVQCRTAIEMDCLDLDAAVHRDEEIALSAHSAQEVAVLDSAPTAAGDGVYGMTMEFGGKAYG